MLYIGLMSGTSLDGIDGALVDFSDKPNLVESFFLPYPKDIKQKLTEIIKSKKIELVELGTIDRKLGFLYAKCVKSLLKKADIKSSEIQAIGSHGQTIYHFPKTKYAFSMQIGSNLTLANETKIKVIGDFRQKDLINQGQGAPLTPIFHNLYRSKNENRFIVNLGGITNLTYLAKDSKKTIAYDSGPANTLLDLWYQKHHKDKDFDKNGAFAKSGKINNVILDNLLKDPYFEKKAPKSTGREYFNLSWLARKIPDIDEFKPKDIQATLCALSAKSLAKEILNLNKKASVYLCGGGAKNIFYKELIEKYLNKEVFTTRKIGLCPDNLEAITFAYFAKQLLEQKTSKLKDITGSTKNSVLGILYNF